MSIPLTIQNITYDYPTQGQTPPWGTEATDWAQAVTTAIASILGNGDIAPSAATILNNQSSPVNVNGLLFDTSSLRGAVIDYSVYRVTSTAEVVEVGTMYMSYLSTANTCGLSIVGAQNSNTVFSITNTGQIQYTTDNMSGSSYTGLIEYRARALPQ